LRECRSIRSGASGLPYYCAPLVCVSEVIELLAVWRHNKPTIETKSGSVQVSDGVEYQHNNMYIINSTFLRTTNGTMDAETTSGQRIGDKITLSVVSFKMILELNERYSYVTFRMMLVRSARGDTPTGTTLWEGNSGNKMLDNSKPKGIQSYSRSMSR